MLFVLASSGTDLAFAKFRWSQKKEQAVSLLKKKRGDIRCDHPPRFWTIDWCFESKAPVSLRSESTNTGSLQWESPNCPPSWIVHPCYHLPPVNRQKIRESQTPRVWYIPWLLLFMGLIFHFANLAGFRGMVLGTNFRIKGWAPGHS